MLINYEGNVVVIYLVALLLDDYCHDTWWPW